MHRVAVFAPGAWKQDNIQDLDLGSSSPVPVDGRTVIAGKRGTVYLLHNSLGGVGSAIRSLGGCASYGGAAHVGHTVVMPCRSGIRALSVHKRSLRWVWTASGKYGSPIIAGKRVFLADTSSGDLEVLSLRTGHLEASMSIGGFTHFPSETVVGNQVFVPTLSGITAVKGAG
jgi:hypothetical protein